METAKRQAIQTGKRVEIPERKGEAFTLYANPDGKTLRMELHTEPIRVKKADGKGFTPIDTTLVKANGVIKPNAVKGGLRLSAGQDKNLLTSQAADATASITTTSVLPEPRLNLFFIHRSVTELVIRSFRGQRDGLGVIMCGAESLLITTRP
ncbi:hypothetical protein [Nonomuraea typhae]|uniref:Uncharacterized protein n=1 Tax=Nonomuraea typhae TaxID=2603600 RepID=A0ABW7YSL9_9ACTN